MSWVYFSHSVNIRNCGRYTQASTTAQELIAPMPATHHKPPQEGMALEVSPQTYTHPGYPALPSKEGIRERQSWEVVWEWMDPFILVRISWPFSHCNCVILISSSHARHGAPFWKVQFLAVVSRSSHRLQRVSIWEWICSTRVSRIPAFWYRC